MESEIKRTIRKEVESHEVEMDSHHINTITDAIYKQLIEYMGEEDLEKLIEEMKNEFIDLVDNLIPFVEEYELKIDSVLNEKMGPIIEKSRLSK